MNWNQLDSHTSRTSWADTQTEKKIRRTIIVSFLFGLISLTFSKAYGAESVVDSYLNGGNNTSDIVRLIVVLTMLSFIPAIIMTLTAFPRIIIVLSFTRNAMGTQQMPPNQVLIGIALVLTFFIMSPMITEIADEAYTPYMAGEIGTDEAYKNAERPLKTFMFNQAKTEPKGLNFFMDLYGMSETPETLEDMPMVVVMMSFITSELKKAFIMGFILYVPFIVVDMITASVLMSMGMMMIPPVTISLPFKILLFVLVDGWTLLFETLVKGFV